MECSGAKKVQDWKKWMDCSVAKKVWDWKKWMAVWTVFCFALVWQKGGWVLFVLIVVCLYCSVCSEVIKKLNIVGSSPPPPPSHLFSLFLTLTLPLLSLINVKLLWKFVISSCSQRNWSKKTGWQKTVFVWHHKIAWGLLRFIVNTFCIWLGLVLRSVTFEALLEKWLWLHYHLPVLFCFTLLRDTLCCSADICYHSVDICYHSKPPLQTVEDCLIQAVCI